MSELVNTYLRYQNYNIKADVVTFMKQVTGETDDFVAIEKFIVASTTVFLRFEELNEFLSNHIPPQYDATNKYE